jgi:hypothetical protein
VAVNGHACGAEDHRRVSVALFSGVKQPQQLGEKPHYWPNTGTMTLRLRLRMVSVIRRRCSISYRRTSIGARGGINL